MVASLTFGAAPVPLTAAPGPDAQAEPTTSPVVNVALCGKRRSMSSALSELIATLGGTLDEALLRVALQEASVGDAHGGSVSALCRFGAHAAAARYVRVHLLLVPTACSRHNSPSRADVVAPLLQRTVAATADEPQLPGATVGATVPEQVIFLVTDPTPVIALAAALGRALPLYTRKRNAAGETSSAVSIRACFFSTTSNTYLDDARLLSHAGLVADHVRQCAALVDRPANELCSLDFIDHARFTAAQLPNVQITVIAGEELRERGFGGIYGVGRAAEHPPGLVVLRYEPPKATACYALVGKGIIYDTGGLSIKDRNSMPGMKRDMGGAAGVLHAFAALVQAGYPNGLYALLCIAENSVGPKATRPDDIHVLYSGMTVEINNTDAEGRLVVGDGVAYAAKHLSPTAIIDMCTLTGAQAVATGERHAAIVCNDDALEAVAVSAGKSSGDLVFPLLYCPEFLRSEFSSSVADMKNSVKNRSNAQSSCAAQFIANNLCDFHGPWLHIDMAAPCYRGERATGYGVALLFDLLQRLAAS